MDGARTSAASRTRSPCASASLHCSKARTLLGPVAACHRATRRPAVPDRRLRSAPVHARPDARPADAPAAATRCCCRRTRLLRLLAVPGPDLHRRGHYRFGRHQHPARQSAAGRDPAAADLPAATGTTAGSGTSAPTTASCTRSACRASTGLPNPPLQTWKPSWPGRPGSRFHCPGHAIRRPHPEGMDVLF